MKRINRNPLRFDGLDLLSKFLLKARISIKTPDALSKFLEALRGTAEEAVQNDILMYGRRTEAMFEMLVASLGKVALLKQEDQGEAYYATDEDIALPDYRLVLRDGAQLLVEVKNHYQATGREPFVIQADYLSKLAAYSQLTKCELLVAIYWAKWNLWTLVPPSAFTRVGETNSVSLGAAMSVSRMAYLGDIMIGTRAPLSFRLDVTEVARDTSSGEDHRTFKIDKANVLSEGRIIEDPIERKIALMLFFYGGWEEQEPILERDSSGTHIDYVVRPRADESLQKKQGFEFVGYLSSMISLMFRLGTSDEAGLTGIRMNFKGGQYSQLIPDNYKSDTLPLWLLILKPNEKPVAESPPDAD